MKTIIESIDVESRSSPGLYYTAVMESNGRVSCNCKGWTMKREGKARECVHTTRLLNKRPTVSDGVYVFLASRAPLQLQQQQRAPVRTGTTPTRTATIPAPVVPLVLPPLPVLPAPGRRRIVFTDE